MISHLFLKHGANKSCSFLCEVKLVSCNLGAGGGRALEAIRPDRKHEHTPLEKTIELPWKTDLFKNKTPVSLSLSPVFLLLLTNRLISACIMDL